MLRAHVILGFFGGFMSLVQTSPIVNEERSQRQFESVKSLRADHAQAMKKGDSMSPEALARLEKISASRNA